MARHYRYHVTTTTRAFECLSSGLLVAKALGRDRCIYLCDLPYVEQYRKEIAARHGVRIGDTTVLCVDMYDLTLSRRKCGSIAYYADIAPERIQLLADTYVNGYWKTVGAVNPHQYYVWSVKRD